MTTTIGSVGEDAQVRRYKRDQHVVQGSASRDVTRPQIDIPLGVCTRGEYVPGEAIQGAFSFLGTERQIDQSAWIHAAMCNCRERAIES